MRNLILSLLPAALRGADPSKPAKAHASFLKLFGPAILDASGNKLDSDVISSRKYLLIYFSAHWCPPCGAFTPKLVKYYNDNDGSKKVNLIFVSSDNSREQWQEYIKETAMPWPTLNFGVPTVKKIKKKYAGPGIPCLVLLDENDRVISHSYVDGKYVGPHKVLDDLTAKLEAESKP